jgi:hypothetical protein
MSDETLDAFVSLSAVLTGFPAEQLKPALDTLELAQPYYEKTRDEAGADLDSLLTAFAAAQQDSARTGRPIEVVVKEQIWNRTDTCGWPLARLARLIVRLWYLGRWDGGDYLSDNAYLNALAWKAMDAKAIGYSEFRDQYWTRPPDSTTPGT